MAFLHMPSFLYRGGRGWFTQHSTVTNTCPRNANQLKIRMMAGGKLAQDKDPKTMTEQDWKEVLSANEFHVLREKGTEYPNTGKYNAFYPKEGHFVCRACGNPLYSAESKFKSGCGWPAFDKCYEGALKTKTDNSFGMRRVEIMCKKCDSHLGHVFEGERFTETNERHCVNSVSVTYVKGTIDKEETKVV